MNLLKGNWREPGTWMTTSKAEGGQSIWVSCPSGHSGLLDDHKVGPDGTVVPSLVCPADDCDWHENVRLEGWTP